MYDVQIETYKNPLGSDPYISTTFRGGSGQVYTQSMDALVLRSDNLIEFELIPYPQVGSQIIMNGTTGPTGLSWILSWQMSVTALLMSCCP